jgi:Chaperone of endosialidase
LVAVSSERFKKDIRPMDTASEAIFSLTPVTFHYKSDHTSTPQFGLVAEEVARVSRALITVDKEGKPFGVRYEQINAMLLNEFLKEHEKVEEQKTQISDLNCRFAKQEALIAQQQKEFQMRIARQESEIAVLMATVKKQAAQIQKVSAQIQLTELPRQTVANTP